LRFQRYNGTQTDFVIVQLDTFDGAAYAQRAFAVSANAQPGQPWTMGTAHSVCGGFLPADAQVVKNVTITNAQGTVGIVVDYRSANLASDFPAQAFVDSGHNQVTRGSFDVFYHYASVNDSSQVDSCELQVGLQQTPFSGDGNG
jgi:hypothetical protein